MTDEQTKEAKEAKEIRAIAELERFAFPGKSEKPFVLRAERLIMSREAAEDAGIVVEEEDADG